MAEIATFRVYPGLGNFEHSTGRRGLYFIVRCYATFKEMREVATEDGVSPASFFRRGQGVCQKWRWHHIPDVKMRTRWRQKECGQILLCRKRLGASIVSHECTHAAVYWLGEITQQSDPDYVRVQCNKRSEELLAYAVGEMTRQVYNGLEESGVLTLGRA